MKNSLQTRVNKIKLCLTTLREANWSFSEDENTQQFCLSRLERLTENQLLEQKIHRELGGKYWHAPKRLLIIVSEKDPLGTLEALCAAYLIGSKIRLKARLSINYLQQVKRILSLDDEECEIIDWQSHLQNDQQILSGVDTVLLAGGEALIQHYRQITPPHIKLVELGPKISGMAIIGKQLPAIELILYDIALFHQQVCSSPRFILLDNPLAAEALYHQLITTLGHLPILSDNLRLQGISQFREHRFTYSLSTPDKPSVYSEKTGWGVTYQTEFAPQAWLTQGFQLVVASIEDSLKQAQTLWPGRLQTLGYFGDLDSLSLQQYSFTRYCPIGRMHQRPIHAPHDGFFMLSALVNFISKEENGDK